MTFIRLDLLVSFFLSGSVIDPHLSYEFLLMRFPNSNFQMIIEKVSLDSVPCVDLATKKARYLLKCVKSSNFTRLGVSFFLEGDTRLGLSYNYHQNY